MESLKKHIEELIEKVATAIEQLDIKTKEQQLQELETDLAQPDAWHDPTAAQTKSKRVAQLHSQIDPWRTLEVQLTDMEELMALGDEELLPEFEHQLTALESDYRQQRTSLYFQGKYDSHNVIMRLSAGVGGTDAQDFTEMLERMYLRFIESSAMTGRLLERSSGDEAGIKTSVIEVDGAYAYGKLKSENGVHRLVRLSPFNSDHLRQTSFARVEILPQIETPEEAVLDEKDLKIDVFRAGGHGGQSVNTTDSAVRITHLPTNTVVAIQNERSQLQNKETALKLLRSELIKMQLDQHAATIDELRAGESASWGSQIRNYVLHPYSLVKDTRTKHEEKDTAKVLDGGIGGFIEAYLEWSSRQ